MDDETDGSFNSRISKIFKVKGWDGLYITIADRWLSGTHVDRRLADIFTRSIPMNYVPDKYRATEAERQEMFVANVLETADTSVADCVWRPLRPDPASVAVRIPWQDRWTVGE